MRVRFWGVRGSTPTPQKENMGYGGNTSCIEIRTDTDQILVFDGGTGLRLLGNELLREFADSLSAPIFSLAIFLSTNFKASRSFVRFTMPATISRSTSPAVEMRTS